MIADIFNRLDYMERRGSGFRKIRGANEAEENYTEDKVPIFFSNRTEFRVTLKNLNYHITENDVLKYGNDVLNEVLVYKGEVLNSDLSVNEKNVLLTIFDSKR